jgi:Probable zinc-ribbon domain
MKSGKKRRQEIKAKRKERDRKQPQLKRGARPGARPLKTAPVNEESLAPYKSYGAPAFVMRGYYEDVPFRCRGCGRDEIWTATQQKWWYEVAKGYVYSTAKWCRPCRKKEQARRAEARRVHLEGVARKKSIRKGD